MKCSCDHTFKFKLASVQDIKIGMHKKFCKKQADTNFASQLRKAMTPKEAQHMNTERREFHC